MIGLPLLTVGRTNPYGGFALGLALIAPFVLEKFWKARGPFAQRLTETKQWLFFALLATLGRPSELPAGLGANLFRKGRCDRHSKVM